MPATVGVPLIVIVFVDQFAIVPVGRPVEMPMPVAPTVVILDVKGVFIQTVDKEATPAVLFGFTIIVPVAFTVPQPPVEGIL